MIDERDIDGCAKCWELVCKAVLTHDALPPVTSPRLAMMHWEVRHEFQDAYGYHPSETRVRYRPTPADVSNMLGVLDWLVHLRRDTKRGGPRDFKLLTSRARGVRWGKIAARFGTHERTAQRWLDAAVAQLYMTHKDEVWRMAK